MGHDLVQLQFNWRNFALERGKARRAVQDQIDEKNEIIREAREDIMRLEREFDDEWREKKSETRRILDEAVKDELRGGRTALSILRELGSQNTAWIYGLSKEVSEEAASPKAAPAPIESVADGSIEGVSWRHHDHTGVHRWLLSEDGKYIKRYGTEGSDFEGEWFVCNRDYNFMAGNKNLFEATSKSEMGKRVAMLEKLLNGTYTGKIKLAPNPYAS